MDSTFAPTYAGLADSYLLPPGYYAMSCLQENGAAAQRLRMPGARAANVGAIDVAGTVKGTGQARYRFERNPARRIERFIRFHGL